MSKNLVDEFLEGVGNAVADVREKVAEEAYFGRVVTDNVSPAPEVSAQEPAAAAPANDWPDYLKESLARDTRDEMPPPEPGFDR
jgi:hypothetical protein